jgi:general secretion pathway protein I
LFQPTSFERQPTGEDLDWSAGFTLIEILVTLAIAAICLAAIGTLLAGNIRGSGRIVQHIALIETMREVETALPVRAGLLTGTLTGDMHGQAWSVDSAPFAGDVGNPRAAKIWTPQMISLTVQSPPGAILHLDTIRLVKGTSAP